LRIGVACFSTFGGSGVIASEIGMAMARRGHHVVFFSDQPPARLDLSCPGISFHPVAALNYPMPAQNSYAVSLAAEMIEVAQTEKLDLLHVHYAVPHAFGAHLARQVLGAIAPKILTTLHGTDVTRIGADPLRFWPAMASPRPRTGWPRRPTANSTCHARVASR
jgi:hypothetical protein